MFGSSVFEIERGIGWRRPHLFVKPPFSVFFLFENEKQLGEPESMADADWPQGP